jgi:hypothetical protein
MTVGQGSLAAGKAAETDGKIPNLWQEVRRVYGFPLTMFALAIIPGLNFTYSGHRGPRWFHIPLCFPYVLASAIIRLFTVRIERFLWFRNFFAARTPLYIGLAFPLSAAATCSLQHTFGLTIHVWTFMKVMISPFPFWYFS